MDSHIREKLSTYVNLFENTTSLDELAKIHVSVFGKKGYFAGLFHTLVKEADVKRKKTMGEFLNIEKQKLEDVYNKKQQKILQTKPKIVGDITVPGIGSKLGNLHIVTQTIEEIRRIYTRIGFYQYSYPEVDWEYFSFEALNMPISHPARDEWETFFIDQKPINKKLGQRILTPHTSSGQVREMEKGILPIRMMNISKTYRRQIDASHSPMFHQFEGLVIDKDINITHLKGTIEYFVKRFFGENREIRLRPHHFQFTEPSFEVDISCGVCEGRGCKLCKEGWLELAGAGLVHPNVLKAGKIDPNKYSGFAFGWGVERSYLMKSGLNIDDIRLLYKNDLRVINQF